MYLPVLIGTTSQPDKQKIRIIEFFFENSLVTLAVWSGKNCSTNRCFRLHIYLRTNKILIHNSLFVLDKRAENLSHKNTQYNCSKKVFTGRTKPIQIIGDPDNLS
jgi:hypothetical protein